MRQYIGARYMPKFMGTYDPTTAYEALSVVDNGMGTSYVANQPVPAGTPLNDTTYWSVYGASSGAIINLENRVTSVENNITGINTDLNNRLSNGVVLVFGDSWADQNDYASYPDRVGWLHDRIISNPKIHCYADSGSGISHFNNTQLPAAISDASFNNGEVSKIVIITGVNDYIVGTISATFISTLNSAIDTMKSTFPNADITLLFDSFSPNCRSGAKTSLGCYSYFKNIVNNVHIPCYYTGLYLAMMGDYENAAPGYSYSNHASAEGSAILGKIFDDVINGKTPSIIRDYSTNTPSDAGLLSIYNIVNNVGTAYTLTNVASKLHVVGNVLELIQDITFNTISDAKIIAIEYDTDNYSAHCFVEPVVLTAKQAVASNTINAWNVETVNLLESLYTGSYGDITVTNALFYYLKNSNQSNKLKVIWSNK